MALVRVLTAAVLAIALTGCTDTRPGPDRVDEVLRMTQPRAVHRATLLQDGRVLVTGGCTERGCEGFDAGRRAEVYDAGAGWWPTPRWRHHGPAARRRCSRTGGCCSWAATRARAGHRPRPPRSTTRPPTRSRRSVSSAPPAPTTARPCCRTAGCWSREGSTARVRAGDHRVLRPRHRGVRARPAPAATAGRARRGPRRAAAGAARRHRGQRGLAATEVLDVAKGGWAAGPGPGHAAGQARRGGGRRRQGVRGRRSDRHRGA